MKCSKWIPADLEALQVNRCFECAHLQLWAPFAFKTSFVRLARSIVPGMKPGVGAERLKTDGEQQLQAIDSKSSNWRSYSGWGTVPKGTKHRLMTEMVT